MPDTLHGKMRALVKPQRASGLELQEVPIPTIGPTDVLIQVTATSICGTDVHIYRWDTWAANRLKPPLVIGHEFAGEIVALGSHVTGFEIGQFVSAEGHIVDHTCAQCRAGQPHICANVQVIGVDRDGCFAEYIAMPAENVWLNAPELSAEVASLQDPFGNAVHTALAQELSGQNVLITGCGPIGLMAIPVALATGALQVFATDINDHRLAMARQMGADRTWNPLRSDVVREVLEATGGVGADVLLEMSGSAPAIDQGFKALRPGGAAALLGLPGKPVTIDWGTDLVTKAATVRGIYGRRIWQTWHQMRALLRTGAVKLEPLITHRLPMRDFEEAFRLMMSQDETVGKVVMTP